MTVSSWLPFFDYFQKKGFSEDNAFLIAFILVGIVFGVVLFMIVQFSLSYTQGRAKRYGSEKAFPVAVKWNGTPLLVGAVFCLFGTVALLYADWFIYNQEKGGSFEEMLVIIGGIGLFALIMAGAFWACWQALYLDFALCRFGTFIEVDISNLTQALKDINQQARGYERQNANYRFRVKEREYEGIITLAKLPQDCSADTLTVLYDPKFPEKNRPYHQMFFARSSTF